MVERHHVHDSTSYFPLKEKGIVRRKTISLIFWGFVLQSFPTSSQLDATDYFLLSSENTLYILERSSHPY